MRASAGRWRGRVFLARVLVTAIATTTALQAQQHPSHERGFDPDKVYQFSELDSVGLLNGNLSIRIPLGGSYPVSGGLGVGVAVHYNSKAWDFQEAGYQGQIYSQALPDRLANSGLGWNLSLGRLLDPPNPLNDYDGWTWVWVGPDGADHVFYRDPHDAGPLGTDPCSPGPCFTRDNSYLRMRTIAATEKWIEFPDGTYHVFHKFTSSSPAISEWRLSLIKDRHQDGPELIDVAVAYPGFPNDTTWEISDKHGRIQRVFFETDLADTSRKRVKRVEVTSFTGALAVYSFSYLPPTTVSVPCGSTLPNWNSVSVSLLSSILLPDGSSYGMQYNTPTSPDTCYANGLVSAMFLPTLGTINWSYRIHQLSIQGCSSRRYFSYSPAVKTRRFLDPAGADLGTWEYRANLFSPATRIPTYGCDQGQVFSLPFQELRVSVLTPQQDTSAHYFSVLPSLEGLEPTPFDPLEYGLSLTRGRMSDQAGRFLSSEVYDCVPDALGVFPCAPLRQTFASYDRDANARCPLEPDSSCYDTNRRLASDRLFYRDDPNTACSIPTDSTPNPGNLCRNAATVNSQFDGLGHFRQRDFQANFGAGDSRSSFTNFNPSRGTFPGTFTLPTAGEPWLLETYDEATVTEAGVTARSQFCFNATTGFLERRRTLKSGTSSGANDLIARFTSDQGNVTLEEYFGGDQQSVATGTDLCSLSLPGAPEYAVQRDFVGGCGLMRKVRYLNGGASIGFESEDYDVHCASGLVQTSRDTAGLRTDYEYDPSGRLRFVKPEQGAWTEYLYTRATGANNLAKVNIYQRPNGGGTALAESGVYFDSLGRVIRQERKMPAGGFAARMTSYNGMGWKSFVSEMGFPGSGTSYLEFDPFGRPGRIQPPDGAAHDVTIAYTGVRQVSRTVKVGTAWNGSAVTESNSTTTETYDGQGRLYQVTEPSGATGGNTTSTYNYDVGNRLKQASTVSGGTTQTRTWSYDNLGLLRFENHPEKTANTYGLNHDVDYVSYDARGHLLRKVDGGSDLTFTYDKAERPLIIRESGGGQRLLKEFAYAAANGTGEWSKGKLATATNHNRFSLCGQAHDAAIEETYTYAGLGGAVSKRDTKLRFDNILGERFAQTVTWTALGLPNTIGYPSCESCSPQLPSRTITNTYSQGWLSGVTPGYASSITYHDNGMVKTVVHGNGVTDAQNLAASNMPRPSSISAANATTTLWTSGGYVYDGAGNITRMSAGYFFYDGVSRLKEGKIFLQAGGASGGTRIQRPTYDAFGNIQTLSLQIDTGTPVPRDVTTNSNTNRLAPPADYSSAGNLVAWNGQTYEYDAFNQTRRVTIGSEDWLHFYTADGERVWSYQVGSTPNNRWTIRDLGGQVLREFVSDSSGWRVERDYIHRDGQLLASETPQGVRHFHLDHLGTPRAISDGGGTRLSYHAYLPFGEEATAFNQDAERRKFTGHERDFGSLVVAGDELDYMHARSASPLTGRFLSADPIPGSSRQPQSWNGYAYALGNPMKYVDPTGMYVTDCPMVLRSCAESAIAFEAARQRNLSSKDSSIRSAAEAYGDAGINNGVTVGFVDPGKGAGGSVQVYSQGDGDGSMSMVASVSIKPGLKGTELVAAVAHEGQHLVDAQAFIASFGPNATSWDLSRNLTSFQTEMNGYRLTHAIFAAAGDRFGQSCAGCALGRGLKTQADVDLASRKILADPSGLYNVTLQNQGPRMFTEWSTPIP